MPASRQRLASATLAAAIAVAPTGADAAPVRARVSVAAPLVSASQASDKLSGVEQHRIMPFNKDFAIPYEALEDQLDDAIDGLIPNKISGVEVCTDPCPDVTWSVKLNPKFKFTKKNQPTLKQIGSSGQSKVRVELKTEARLDIHADVHAETWFDSVDAPIDVFVVIGMTARVDVSLWPTLKAQKPGTSESGVELEFTLVDSDMDLDIDGKAASLGMKWGTIIGLSPVGVFAGGPILGPILAIIGDEAADAATEEIGRRFDEQVAVAFEAQTEGLEDVAHDYIDPYITQANDLKDDLLDTPIPGVNKTLEQLEDELGAEIKLHTVASTSNVHSAAVMRFSSAAAGGKVLGKVRVPKKTCEYASISVGGFKAKMPLGLVDDNQDLAAKVGQACSAVLTEKFGRKSYLGANPKDVLGSGAQNLPNWSGSVGTLTYKGNMSQTADYYECAYELTGLPKAAILAIESGDLAERGIGVNRRVLEVTAAGKSAVFDNQLKPLPVSGGNSSLVIGGKGQCGGGSSSGGLTPSKMKELKDMLDPEKCPQCGIKNIKGSHIYEVTNPQAFFDTKLGKEIKANISKAKSSPKAGPGAKTAPKAQPASKASPAAKSLPKSLPKTGAGGAVGQ